MSDTRQYVQARKTTLYGSGVTSSATTIILSELVTPQGTNITTSDFGTLGYATLEPGTTREENISFTTVTQNADGTATLTGVTRGLDFVASYGETAGLKKAHAGGTDVIISNSAPFYDNFVNKANDETITGTHTFTTSAYPKMSDSTTNPTADAELATKGYVDGLALGGSTNINRVVVSGTAGATVAAGEVVYLDETDNEWKLADASAAATADNVQLGIAQGAGTDGAAITGGVLILGRDSNQTGLSQGDRVYLSDTAGAIATSAGTQEVELGHAISATEIDFDPRYASIPTGDEKDALAGTSGTPGSGNLYATELGNQLAAENYATSTTGNDTYVVTLDPVPAAYAAGMIIRFVPDTANTGAATINVNSLGAKNITKNGTTALDDNDILANEVATIVYDGTQFQLQNVGIMSSANATDLTDGGATTLHTHQNASARLSVVTGNVTSASDTSENNIFSVSVPAGTLGTGNAVRAKIMVSALSLSSTKTVTFRLKYGSTTIATEVITNGAGGSATMAGYIDAIVMASGATNTQEGSIFIDTSDLTGNQYESAGGGAQTFDQARGFELGTAAEDSTGALNFIVSYQFNNSSASDTITIPHSIIESIGG